jgi:hypothetical protein
VINLTNKKALFNFLSTFTGKHFVSARTSCRWESRSDAHLEIERKGR